MRGIVDVINGHEKALESLSDDALAGHTGKFKERLANGESLDDMLPEAFAVVREASRRVLGMRHFDVQMIGGICRTASTEADEFLAFCLSLIHRGRCRRSALC